MAALTVVVHHMALPNLRVDAFYGAPIPLLSAFVSFGQFGVDLFFVISGFIMVVTTWKIFGSPGAAGSFILRRAFRIYPPYWLALIPVVAAHAYLHHRGVSVLGGAHDAKINGLATFLLLPHPLDEFLSLPPAWTLVFEISFYAVFAVLLTLPRKAFVPALLTWLTAAIVFAFAFDGTSNYVLQFIGTPLPIEFILGAFAGLLYVKGQTRYAGVALLLGSVGIVGLWAAEIHLGDVAYAHLLAWPHDSAESSYHNTLGRVLMAGVPAAFVVYGAVALELQQRLWVPRWLTFIGDTSYALYLWNLTIIVMARQLFGRLPLHGLVMQVVVELAIFVAVVGVSIVVYRCFERPVTDWLNAALRRRRALVPAR